MTQAVFVTVGTTKFDDLISVIQTESVLQEFANQQFGKVEIQYGRGAVPQLPNDSIIEVETFDFKPSLHENFQNASLVISHGGMKDTNQNKQR
jgi:beta-1,4-N-acetylglucosaminyltransferase